MSDTLLHYLREARATEAGLSQTLKVHIAATPFGEHRARLERHLEQTRAHERRVGTRLAELERDGVDPVRQALSLVASPVGFGLGVARGATRAMLTVVGLPLSLFRDREPKGADRVLRNVRAEAASEALEIATYTAIERIAAAEDDEETALLAADIRADEEEMLEYLKHAVVELSDVLAGKAEVAGRGAEVAGRGAEEAEAEPEQEPEPIRLRDDGAPIQPPVTSHEPPEPVYVPEATEPVHVSEEPELVAEVAELGAEEPAGAEVQIEEPWDGYDRMKASEIEQRLEDASDELAAVVRLYETGGKNRQTVIRAADRRLRILSDRPPGPQ
jgi:ferritin-like metal-binding protein YciE